MISRKEPSGMIGHAHNIVIAKKVLLAPIGVDPSSARQKLSLEPVGPDGRTAPKHTILGPIVTVRGKTSYGVIRNSPPQARATLQRRRAPA
jgi:hypothetical protein